MALLASDLKTLILTEIQKQTTTYNQTHLNSDGTVALNSAGDIVTDTVTVDKLDTDSLATALSAAIVQELVTKAQLAGTIVLSLTAPIQGPWPGGPLPPGTPIAATFTIPMGAIK